MQQESVYEEKLFSKWITIILTSATAIMFFFLVYQLVERPIGGKPAPTWILLVIGLIFLGLTINFSRIIIRMTPEHVSIGYGIFKHEIPWETVENCYIDETSAVRYGGSGIRVTKVGDKKRIVYSVVGSPRVVLSLKEGTYKEVAFSTRNPDQVMSIVNQWAGLH
jgi:hypothetical protein